MLLEMESHVQWRSVSKVWTGPRHVFGAPPNASTLEHDAQARKPGQGCRRRFKRDKACGTTHDDLLSLGNLGTAVVCSTQSSHEPCRSIHACLAVVPGVIVAKLRSLFRTALVNSWEKKPATRQLGG